MLGSDDIATAGLTVRGVKLLGLVLGLIGLWSPWMMRAAEPSEEVRLQLKWRHQFQSAGYYAAVDQGYFREAGFDVTLLEDGPAIDPTERVVNGAADFGIGASGLVVSRSGGEPVVAVAAIFQHSPYALMARDDPAIRDVHDLEGRKVMVEPHAEELMAYLTHEGVDIGAIERVPHGGDPMALAREEVAAMTTYTTTEPFVLETCGIPYQIFDPKVAGIDFYGDTLFTLEKNAKRHEKRVVAFRDAIVRGWRYAFRHQEEIIDLIRTKYDASLSHERLRFEAEKIRRLLLPDLIEVGYMNKLRWQHIVDEFDSAGLLDRPVDLEAFVFKPQPEVDWAWVYWSLFMSGAVLTVVSIALWKFYSLS